ncbi:MAG: hypothetical protein MUC50_00510 [Myxococcota bacterium]|jgi:hypothetical protein|nr:hypothetical protein [Myxococcota bacterium]
MLTHEQQTDLSLTKPGFMSDKFTSCAQMSDKRAWAGSADWPLALGPGDAI